MTVTRFSALVWRCLAVVIPLLALVPMVPLGAAAAPAPEPSADLGQLLDGLQPKPGANANAASRGTGFFIGNTGLILTANHILQGKSSIVVMRSPGQEEVPVKLLKADPVNDLALLLYPQPFEGLRLADWSSVPIGLEVFVFGFPTLVPSLNTLRITSGLINGMVATNASPPMFQLSAAIHQGDSGGPVVASDGSVVGMVRGKIDTTKFARLTGDFPQNINLAMQSSVIATFLAQSGFVPTRAIIDPMSKTPTHILYKATAPAVVVVKAR